MASKHIKSVSVTDLFARNNRDGSETVKVSAYPTRKELRHWKVLQRAMGYLSISQLVTESVKSMEVNGVRYTISLTGVEADRAEVLAEAAGYRSAEEWFNESLRMNVNHAWDERTRVIPPDMPA